jgi:acyl carrier protein
MSATERWNGELPGAAGDRQWDWARFSGIACDALSAVLDPPVDDLRPGDHLLDDIGLDSFGLLLFVTELEHRLGAELPAADVEPTAENVYRLVRDTCRRPTDL